MTNNEQIAVGRTNNGAVVFFNPATQHDIRQIRTHVPDDTSDLSQYVQIPQLGAFVRELLAADEAKEA